MSDHDTGDAWRYASNLNDPAAVRALLQAALTALGTITFARKNCAGEQFETVPDWPRVQAELRAALKAAGHPAGDTP
jgi:hypothetical protein